MQMKRYLTLGLLIVLITVCLISLQYFVHNVTHKEVKTKHILYWTDASGNSDFNLGLGREAFLSCPAANCYTTMNKTYLPVEEFDAILFHKIDMTDAFEKPERRSHDQYYIYFAREPPENDSRYTDLHNFFNWTMTYRLDSDVIYPYGFYRKSKTNYNLPSEEEIKGKPHKIASIESFCHTPSKRELLYPKINKSVEVEVFGDCGNTICFKKDSKYVHKFLEENFKFYLVLEMLHCEDYITSELYEILQTNLIPIVYGGADYTNLMPPRSVIDVGKFDTVEELANYIKTLDENLQEYLTYFAWKKNYVVEVNHNKLALCNLCKQLNKPIAHKSYSSMYVWWDNQNKCKHGSSLPKILFT